MRLFLHHVIIFIVLSALIHPGLAMSRDCDWLFHNPLPQGNNLDAVWSVSPTEYFAIGENSAILHSVGGTFDVHFHDTRGSLKDMWGTSGTNIFAVGYAGADGIILHYNGTEWTTTEIFPSCDLQGIWGTSSLDIFTAGKDNIYHFNGTTWVGMSGYPLEWYYDVWGTSSTDVFAAGEEYIVHYDGVQWSVLNQMADFTGLGVWGSSPDDVFVSGLHSILHFDGTTWTMLRTGRILHYNGSTWETMTTPSDVTSFWDIGGTGFDDVYSISQDRVFRYNGSTWSVIYELYNRNFSGGAIEVQSSIDITVVGISGGIYKYDGLTWEQKTKGVITDKILRGVWGTSDSNLYAVGDSGTILHFDGTSYSTLTTSATSNLVGIWGTSDTDIFIAGTSEIMHYDGLIWDILPLDPDCGVYDIWGISGNDVYMAGFCLTIPGDPDSDVSMVFHYNGSTWSAESLRSFTGFRSYGVWGSSDSNVFVVDSYGVFHFDGVTWSPMAGSPGGFNIWGFHPDELFIQDYDNIHYYDGASWIKQYGKNNLTDIWGTSSTDMYGVGFDSRFMHYDGSDWTLLPLEILSDNVLTLFGFSSSNIYAAGLRGTVINYRCSPEVPSTLYSATIFICISFSVIVIFFLLQSRFKPAS